MPSRPSRAPPEPVDRSLEQAHAELKRIRGGLAVNDAVARMAAQVYGEAHARGIVRGRSIAEVAAAALYVACRVTATPRSLRDVERAANVKRKSLARCYRLLLNELDLKMPSASLVRCVSRIAGKIGISKKTERRAAEMLRRAEGSEVFGRDPMGLAAAALYLACVKNGEGKTQRSVAEAASVTEVTIRSGYKSLERADAAGQQAAPRRT